MKRVLSALILASSIVVLVIYSPLWLFALITSAVSLLALHEYFNISQAAGFPCLRILGYSLALLIAILQFTGLSPHWIFIIAFLSLFIAALVIADPEESLPTVASTFLGVFYTGYLLSLFFLIKKNPLGHQYILYLFVVAWAGDTFAYYVGRSIGRHLLAPRISPKKTVEGSLGGLVGSIFCALIFQHFSPLMESTTTLIILTIVLNVFGQLGDLAESSLKRSAHLKDSSTLIPGHGGILDRIDSLLFSAPVLYLFLLTISSRPTG